MPVATGSCGPSFLRSRCLRLPHLTSQCDVSEALRCRPTHISSVDGLATAVYCSVFFPLFSSNHKSPKTVTKGMLPRGLSAVDSWSRLPRDTMWWPWGDMKKKKRKKELIGHCLYQISKNSLQHHRMNGLSPSNHAIFRQYPGNICSPRLVTPDNVRVGGREMLWKDATPFREAAGDTNGSGLEGPTASRSAMASSETAMPPYFHSDPHPQGSVSKEDPYCGCSDHFVKLQHFPTQGPFLGVPAFAKTEKRQRGAEGGEDRDQEGGQRGGARKSGGGRKERRDSGGRGG